MKSIVLIFLSILCVSSVSNAVQHHYRDSTVKITDEGVREIFETARQFAIEKERYHRKPNYSKYEGVFADVSEPGEQMQIYASNDPNTLVWIVEGATVSFLCVGVNCSLSGYIPRNICSQLKINLLQSEKHSRFIFTDGCARRQYLYQRK